jgi:GTP cyclohydrolase II
MERTTTKVRTPDKAGDVAHVGSCSCGGYPEAGLPEVKSRARGFRVQVQGVVRAHF